MKDPKKNLSILWVIAILAIIVVPCGMVLTMSKQNAPREKYVLKFNHVLTESEPFHKGLRKWACRVGERTVGGLEIQVFHSAQLGMEEDIIEQLRQGAPRGQNTDAARLGMYVPEFAVMNAPYFVDSIDDVAKLKELPTIRQWQKELEDKYNIKILSFNWVQGMRHMVTNKPIRTPEDLWGLRIRTPDAPIWKQSIRSVGAEKEMEKEVVRLKKELTQKGMIIVEDVDVAAFRKASEEAYRVLHLTEVRDRLYEEMGKR
ncbi:MAG: sialic acid-binding periplasmic protein SiaP [Firmicutes bacterium]|nr:sialic acid-binding periplasmic protein SiaP [Bacillota bacterium]